MKEIKLSKDFLYVMFNIQYSKDIIHDSLSCCGFYLKYHINRFLLNNDILSYSNSLISFSFIDNKSVVILDDIILTKEGIYFSIDNYYLFISSKCYLYVCDIPYIVILPDNLSISILDTLPSFNYLSSVKVDIFMPDNNVSSRHICFDRKFLYLK